jgi:predicted nucleic acid-binding protein
VKIALDAATVSRLIASDPPHLRGCMDAALERGDSLVMSALVLHDLAYAAMTSDQAARKLAQLDAFIAQVEVVPWTSEDALTAARLRADHDKVGRLFQTDNAEFLHAAQALSHEWVVIVEDRVKEAGVRMLGLRTIDWSASDAD